MFPIRSHYKVMIYEFVTLWACYILVFWADMAEWLAENFQLYPYARCLGESGWKNYYLWIHCFIWMLFPFFPGCSVLVHLRSAHNWITAAFRKRSAFYCAGLVNHKNGLQWLRRKLQCGCHFPQLLRFKLLAVVIVSASTLAINIIIINFPSLYFFSQ